MRLVVGRAVACLLAGLLAVPLAQADWLQDGHDAQRTGATTEDGPAWGDVVFRLDLGNVSTFAGPVVIGKHAYLARSLPRDSVPTAPAVAGQIDIMRVDLETAHQEVLASSILPTWPEASNLTDVSALASDGQTLYLMTQQGFLVAQPIMPGAAQAWATNVFPLETQAEGDVVVPTPTRKAAANFKSCFHRAHVAVHEDTIYVACDLGGFAAFGAKVSKDGQLQWSRYLTDTCPNTMAQWFNGRDDVDPLEVAATGVACGIKQGAPAGYFVFPTGVALFDDVLVIGRAIKHAGVGGQVNNQVPLVDGEYHALDTTTGEVAWIMTNGLGESRGDAEAVANMGNWPSPPMAQGDHVFMEVNRGIAVRARDSQEIHQDGEFIDHRTAELEGDPGSGFASVPGGTYAASARTIVLLDESLTIARTFDGLPPSLEWGPGSLLLTENALLATAGPQGSGPENAHNLVFALEPRTLRPLWSHAFDGHAQGTPGLAVSDGLLVAAFRAPGSSPTPLLIEVLGTSDASLDAVGSVSNLYPAPGESVRIDLSRTRPGLFGAANAFRAEWGDGSSTEWQGGAVFTHRFRDLVDAEARFYARNDAGQTSSIPFTFHVGGTPPNPTFLEQAFNDDNQNTSFFVLGLAVTALAGLWGFFNVGRRRRRLAAELRELEAVFQATKDHAAKCEAALGERKTRARALFLERRLEEAHASFLEKRVEELQRQLRMGAVDERLKVLPHGLVLQLQRLLVDSRVDAWERSHFMDALEREKDLTKWQKADVRRLIDSWFTRDAAVGSNDPAP